jgi:predicted nuclease with TOPRIM domain
LRIKREYEFLKKRAVNSKEETSDLGRETNRLVENCKRLEGKLDEANKRVRLLDDEVFKTPNSNIFLTVDLKPVIISRTGK